MDFHSLSRRELQALCKMNKIPANTTNLAMADALQALESVDGLEEMMAQSEAGYLETPAKSMTAARSVSRTSNRPKTLQEEPDSKLTTKSRRGTRKVEGETDAAPQSACPRIPMAAQSARVNVESSTAVRGYNTRRSTRLLEKQMCELSLKDSEDLLDSNVDEDSQDLQRQFTQDIDNSLAPENKEFSDVCNVTKEATEEPKIENMDEKSFPTGVESVEPVSKDLACDVENAFNDENMDVILEDEKSFPNGVESAEPVSKDHACDAENAFNDVEVSSNDNACDAENAFNDVEVSSNDKEFKNDEDQPMQEDVEYPCNQVEESVKEKRDEDQPMQEDVADEMEMVSHPSLSNNGTTEEGTQELNNVEETIENKDEEGTQELVNVEETIESKAEEGTQELINVEETIENKADSTVANENSSDPAMYPQTDGSVDSNAVKQVDSQINQELSSALIASANGVENEAVHMDAIQMVPEAPEDEFGFLSESDVDMDENENALPVDSVLAGDETEEVGDETEEESGDETEEVGDETEEESGDETEEASDETDEESGDETEEESVDKTEEELRDELAEDEGSSDEVISKSPLKARSPLTPRDQIQSSGKKPTSVGRVPVSDNIENLQMMGASKPVLAKPGGKTPLERKSLRQLKKMVRGLYKQPQQLEATQKPAPLQAHTENVK